MVKISPSYLNFKLERTDSPVYQTSGNYVLEDFIFTLYLLQGWEFAHRFSERIARFLPKNERMSDSLKKMSDSLICSFLVSNLSNSLTIAHFL